MPSWLKKAFSKKDEKDPPPSSATRPSTSGAQSSPQQQSSRRTQSSRYPSHRSSSTPSSSSRIYSGVVNTSSGAPVSRNRVSTHDLTMAAVTLGVAPTSSPPPVQDLPSGSSSSTPAAEGSLRPDLQQQQIDSDLAMAYSLAQGESGSSHNNEHHHNQQLQPAPPPLPPPQRPLAPVNHQQHPAMPMASPFGEAVSLPPPAPGERPDLAMAAVLAESQFSARQADELARTTEAVYQAALDKALEASLQTANYDDLLRDIKLWVIDLAASTDDVLAALDSIVRQRQEVEVRLEKALDSSEGDYDERKIRKLSWMSEQLPNMEDKLRILADKMTPIGVAVVELQDLRDHVLATSPPLEEAGREKYAIITRLFNTMEEAGLRPSSRSDGEVDYNGAGPSTSRPISPAEVQAPADLRDLVAALIDEAQKLPKRPRKKKSSGSIATSATTATTSLADPSEFRELPATPESKNDGDANGDNVGEGTPQSIPVVATGVAAAVSGVAASNLANGKRGIEAEEKEEEKMPQPSAPEADHEVENQQEELSLDVLPTPLGNDLVSFAVEEEVRNPGVTATATATADLLQPHQLENLEEEEGERQQELTPTAATLSTVPPHSPSSEQPQEEQIGTPTDTDNATSEEMEKEQTEVNKKTPLWHQNGVLWRRLSTRSPATTSTPGSASSPSSSIPSATSTQSGSRRTSAGTFTTPVPFQLSSSRWKAKGPSEAPTTPDTLRRLPALISLHYELEKDSGVVADALGWTSSSNNEKTKVKLGAAVAVAPPAALSSSTTFESPDEMIAFVKAQPDQSFPVTVPSRFDASSRWSVICAAAGAHEALMTALQELSSWEVQTPSVVSESHRLVDYLARVSSILSTVANTHDPLRHAVVKHHLPWEESLTPQVRWAAQRAGIAVMSQAIEASEEAERAKGAWQRQAVLKPLGHGVMAAFSVHQLAGGFGTEAAAVCDYLVERTMHYARMIDPKWFRGHKVVTS